ncbi:hypothetical protein DB313_05550 (plasmid) [Borrelia turcica IST7]|uniref:Uncharacterized protein n=1 Tax=Borrelia turcica IST7 TaxID=1104446 RepID=A0A386PN88_9SPIR|nr:hypothetical protein DB313_05550 [Borrelia turcica IST7]
MRTKLEARKVDLKRHSACKALLAYKIIATGKGSISADTIFTTNGDRQYRITENITFNKDSDIAATLEALNERANYNLESGI